MSTGISTRLVHDGETRTVNPEMTCKADPDRSSAEESVLYDSQRCLRFYVANYEHDVDLARQDFQVVPFTIMVRVIDYC
jgi:hypothetical protein